MNQPHISVIMPTFNTVQWLGQAIESVRLQTGVSWELLIIDDGSTDGTWELARNYAAFDARIRVMKNEGNKGASGARNTGMRKAKGALYMFLDGDDVFFPGAFEALYAGLKTSGMPVVRGLGAVFCMQRKLFSPATSTKDATATQEFNYPVRGFWLHIYQADFLHKHGIHFPEDLTIAEDVAFLCQLYPLLSEVPVINQPVHIYRINHKETLPSAKKSIDIVTHMVRARTAFTQHNKPEWISPYIEAAFLSQWLQRLHAAQAESEDCALEFLNLCRSLMNGLEEALRPALQKQLGASAAAFLNCCETGDSAGMLAVLQKSGNIRPVSAFMGIERLPQGVSWQWYLLSRRVYNTLLSPTAWKALWYLWQLQSLAMFRRYQLRSAIPAPDNTQGN